MAQNIHKASSGTYDPSPPTVGVEIPKVDTDGGRLWGLQVIFSRGLRWGGYHFTTTLGRGAPTALSAALFTINPHVTQARGSVLTKRAYILFENGTAFGECPGCRSFLHGDMRHFPGRPRGRRTTTLPQIPLFSWTWRRAQPRQSVEVEFPGHFVQALPATLYSQSNSLLCEDVDFSQPEQARVEAFFFLGP